MALLSSSYRSGVGRAQGEAPVSVKAAPQRPSQTCCRAGAVATLPTKWCWLKMSFTGENAPLHPGFLRTWLCFTMVNWVLNLITGLCPVGNLCLSSFTTSNVFTACLTLKPQRQCWEVTHTVSFIKAGVGNFFFFWPKAIWIFITIPVGHTKLST